MPVKDLRNVGVWLGVSTLAACGPDLVATESTWMPGVWSSAMPGDTLSVCGVSRLEIRDDGVVLEGGGKDGTCLSLPAAGKLDEYIWERLETDEIDVRHIADQTMGFRVSPGQDCNQIGIRQIFNGEVQANEQTYYRGRVCGVLICAPAAEHCDEYVARWCDEAGETPTCEEET